MRTLPSRVLRALFGSGAERWARLATFVAVAGVTAFVVAQMHPALIFTNTEDVGGDTAAHITAPYFLIHHLLPHGEITGWDPWWFDGFPLYVFYFPLPALLVAVFNLFAPYAVAFKIVTALGTVTLPLCCWAFGRLAGFRRPVPALFAAATVPYLFNDSYTINGGNIFSTQAGEFSFSLALSFAVLFLGVFVHALRTGRLRWLAPVLFLLTLLSHVVPALFVAGAAILLALAYGGTGSWRRALIPIGATSGLLVAFWLLPFGAYVSHYSSSMNYGPVLGTFWANVTPPSNLPAIFLAGIGFLIAVWRAQRVAVSLGLAGLTSATLFQWSPTALVYNGRWLPFWFLVVYLLAAYAVAEVGALVFGALRLVRANEVVTPIFTSAVAVGIIAAWLGMFPLGAGWNFATNRNSADGWTTFNYRGYQEMPGWPEYRRIIAMLDGVAKRYGCGRLDYEYTSGVNNYISDYFGSTLWEMSLPLWTDGCIDSTEGVYFESSTTTHFHFLDQAEVSNYPSNPAVLTWNGASIYSTGPNVVDGVKHLQLQGVDYFLANAPNIEAQADADPALVRLASIPANPQAVDVSTAPKSAEWVVYKIKDASLITPLHYDPVVEPGLDVVSVADASTPAGVALLWYLQKQYWDVPIAADGPPSWRRYTLGKLVYPSGSHPVVPTTVSHIRSTNSTVSFDVGRLNSPVEVKVPYFPNWHASGASGPYLVTPNLMVVVPTSHHVVLRYGTTGIDWIGTAATILGLLLLPLWLRRVSPPPFAAPSGWSLGGGDRSADGGGDRDADGGGDRDRDGDGDGDGDGGCAPGPAPALSAPLGDDR